MPLLFILIFFIVNVLIYFKSSRWRKQQQFYVQSFIFLIDYYVFIFPIIVLLFVLAFLVIFMSNNSTLDTIMTNIFPIDYDIFIPIDIIEFVLIDIIEFVSVLPDIFMSGNSILDTIMTNIFMIELYLFSFPALLLWNFHMVYPNLKFLCSSYNKKNLNYEVLKKGSLCLEVILCCILIPSIHYISIIFLVGMSLFLEYKITDDS